MVERASLFDRQEHQCQLHLISWLLFAGNMFYFNNFIFVYIFLKFNERKIDTYSTISPVENRNCD